VSDNRKINRDSVELLAQGKVWTGYEALQNGLVDEVGGLKQAIDYVAKSKDLKDYRIVFYPEKRPLFVLPKNTFINSLLSIFGIVDGSAAVEEVTETVANVGLFTRLPFDISIE
jgi:protease-4